MPRQVRSECVPLSQVASGLRTLRGIPGLPARPNHLPAAFRLTPPTRSETRGARPRVAPIPSLLFDRRHPSVPTSRVRRWRAEGHLATATAARTVDDSREQDGKLERVRRQLPHFRFRFPSPIQRAGTGTGSPAINVQKRPANYLSLHTPGAPATGLQPSTRGKCALTVIHSEDQPKALIPVGMIRKASGKTENGGGCS